MGVPARAEGTPDSPVPWTEDDALELLRTDGLGDRIRQGDEAAFVEFLGRSGIDAVAVGPAEVVHEGPTAPAPG